MIFEVAYIWLIIGALLVLASALSGDVTLIALALAAATGAGVAAVTEFGGLVQVGVVAVVAGVLGPVMNLFLRPLLRGPSYGVTGSGGEAGMKAIVERTNGQLGVRLKHDFFPARSESGGDLAEGQPVVVQRFEGITAIVELAESDPRD